MRFTPGIKTILAFALSGSLAACGAPMTNANVYNAGNAMKAQIVHQGTVIDMRTVETRHIQQGDSAIGVVAGGAAGALIGHQFGNGAGNALATGAGTLAGAALGHTLATQANRSASQQWFVQLDNGTQVSVIQNDTSLYIGQRVRVIQDGNSTRIIH